MSTLPNPPENPSHNDPLAIALLVVWAAMLAGAIAYMTV